MRGTADGQELRNCLHDGKYDGLIDRHECSGYNPAREAGCNNKNNSLMRTTKIVATLGPSTDTPDSIRKLLDAGVDVFRLNASHGVQEDHARRMNMVRELAAATGVHVGHPSGSAGSEDPARHV